MAASEVPHDIADMVNEWKVSEDPGYWETGSDWVVSEETGVDVSFKPIDNYTAEFVDKLPISEGEKKLLRSHISLVSTLFFFPNLNTHTVSYSIPPSSRRGSS